MARDDWFRLKPEHLPRTSGIEQPKFTCFKCRYWGTQYVGAGSVQVELSESYMETGDSARCWLSQEDITDWSDGCDDGKDW